MLSCKSRHAALVKSLLPPSWSVTGSGLWFTCFGCLSETQRPGQHWHPVLRMVLYVWLEQLKLTKLGLFLQAWLRLVETSKESSNLRQTQILHIFSFYVWNRRSSHCTANIHSVQITKCSLDKTITQNQTMIMSWWGQPCALKLIFDAH